MSTINFKVAVVIVTYNGAEWIKPCLDSVWKSNYPAQVIVVDNASSDSTSEIIRSQFSQTILIESDKNLGFGQANNLGIAKALQQGVDYIFLLNQDTIVEADSIGKLVEGFELHPIYDLLSPAHYNGEGTAFDFGFKRFALQDYSPEEVDTWYSPQSETCFEISFVNAAAWFIKASVFEKIGGFSPLFFHYGEDREYVKRMQFHQLKSGVIPGAKIHHFRDDRTTDKSEWTYERRKKYYHTGFLDRMSDVNHSLLNRFFFSLSWFFKDCLALFAKGVFSAPVMFFHVLYKAFSSLPDIKAHREKVKHPAPFLFLTRYMNQKNA